jgi:DNA-binding CsgD family transcriptional regulator
MSRAVRAAARRPAADQAVLGQALGDAVDGLGSPRFVARLATLLGALAHADDITIVLYRSGQAPELVHDQSAGSESATNLALYLKGAYLLDPFYRAFADGVAPGCYRLRQLAPAAFRASEYFRLHYARTGLRDEIGFLLQQGPQFCVHLSLGRRAPRARFSAVEHRRLLDFEPALRALVARHWAPPAATGTAPLTTALDAALKFFGRDFLTEREAEVLQLLLRGHSTKSIAERLRISPETVKLHRKHSYAKLDVSSQAELFHLFIDALGSRGSYSGGAPLTGYVTRPEPR